MSSSGSSGESPVKADKPLTSRHANSFQGQLARHGREDILFGRDQVSHFRLIEARVQIWWKSRTRCIWPYLPVMRSHKCGIHALNDGLQLTRTWDLHALMKAHSHDSGFDSCRGHLCRTPSLSLRTKRKQAWSENSAQSPEGCS